MRKILFVINNLNTGGIQKSLINLLYETSKSYCIDLIVFSHQGEYIEQLPKEINLLPQSPILKLLGANQVEAKNVGFLFFLIRGFFSILTRIVGARFTRNLLISFYQKKLIYDTAISFTHNFGDRVLASGCNEFVINKVKCQNKITFVHCDFEKSSCNTKYNFVLYSKFNKVACVSNSCRNNFLKFNPQFSNKTFTVRNCIDYRSLHELSREDEIQYNPDYINIVTVARLSPEKGIDTGIDVLKRLIDEGFNLRWYIIGGGNEKGVLEDKIKNNSLKDNIFLLGNQMNPYRYMKNADLFFLPSLHEAAPIVFDESKALGLPIVTTDTCSAKEMIEQANAGWVVENDKDIIYNCLHNLCINKNLLKLFEKNNISLCNDIAISQFNNLVL